jgi:hypothetical protein
MKVSFEIAMHKISLLLKFADALLSLLLNLFRRQVESTCILG